MKTKFLLVSSLLVLTLLAAACGGTQPTIPPNVVETVTSVVSIPETGSVEDFDSLMEALRTAGANVEVGDNIEQAFFTQAGKILKVNGVDVQVFVFDTAEAMEAEAAKVAADGGSIGTSMVNWIESPHFYKMGRLLVLYVGEDQTIKDLLEGVFGPQFAGR